MDEDTLFLILGILAAGALAAIIVFFQKRRAGEAWVATVTRIEKYGTGEEGAEYVRVRFERDDGKAASFELPAKEFAASFPGLEAGGRLVKPAGESVPRQG